MISDSRCKWFLIVATAGAATLLAIRIGLTFPVRDLIEPCMIVASLSLVTWYYRRRQYESFVVTLTGLMQLVAFASCYTTTMYAVAAIGRPLIDDACVSFDAAFGISVSACVDWTAAHPNFARLLQWAYGTVMLQTALVIAWLGLSGRSRELRSFLTQFMLGTWIVLAVFALFPAAGPFRAYGFEPAPDQLRYLAHFDALRSGARTVITWRDAEGLITFPSFHTAWAILLAFALRRDKWLFGPSLVLNLAVIVSTMTTGWHYFADVVSGTGTAVVAISLSYALEFRWLAKPRMLSPIGTPAELREFVPSPQIASSVG